MAERDTTNPGPDRILERILVAVGGSEPSFAALEYALDLTRASGSKLRILRVAEPILNTAAAYLRGDVLAHIVPVLERQAQVSGREIEERITTTARDRSVQFDLEVTDGRVARGIIAHARDATIIVIGKVGHREDHGGLLGTNTERIVRRTGRPILLTPSRHDPIRHVLLAFGSKDVGGGLPLVADGLAKALRADVSVVTVAEARDASEQAWAEIRGAIPSSDRKYGFRHETGAVPTGILRHGSHKSLLVMGAYHHSRLYHLALGSVTEEVMRKFPGPVLLVR